MKKLSSLLVASAFVALSVTSAASELPTPSYESGKAIGELCISQSIESIVHCGRYVYGVQDALSSLRAMGVIRPGEVAFCIPSGTTGMQLIAVVRKHFQENPDDIAQGAEVFGAIPVMTALVQGFPCKAAGD